MLAAAPASAQTFPSRTIHIVVAYAPGGTGDIVARLIAVPLAEALGQNIVIENRAGATGAIGTQAVVSAPPDGHTLLMGQTGEIAINQHWIKGLTYNAEKDLAAGRARLGGAAGAGGPGQGAVFDDGGTGQGAGGEEAADLRLRRHRHARAFRRRIPQASHQGQSHPRAIQGRGARAQRSARRPRRYVFPGFPAATPLLKAGQVKILAVSSGKRASGAPDIPTVAEAINDPNFDLDAVAGLLRAGRHAGADRQRGSTAEINKILASPEMQGKLRDAGADVRIGSSEQFAAFAKAESEKYLQIIKDLGVKPE